MSELYKAISQSTLSNLDNLAYTFSVLKRNKKDVLKILLITFIYCIPTIGIVLYYNGNDFLYMDYKYENTIGISLIVWLFVTIPFLGAFLLRYIDKIYQNEIGAEISLKKYVFYLFKYVKYCIFHIVCLFCIRFVAGLITLPIMFIASSLGDVAIMLIVVSMIVVVFFEIVATIYLYIVFFEYVVVQNNLDDSIRSPNYLGLKKMCKITLIALLNSLIIGIGFLGLVYLVTTLGSLLVYNVYWRMFITFSIVMVLVVITNILIFTTIFVKYMNYTYLKLGKEQMIKCYKFNGEEDNLL